MLCEKPLTLNLAEAEAMVEASTRADRFLMEAMWIACHPVVLAVLDGIRGRAVRGRPAGARRPRVRRRAAADEPDARPSPGGGALLDMGIYPLTFAT